MLDETVLPSSLDYSKCDIFQIYSLGLVFGV